MELARSQFLLLRRVRRAALQCAALIDTPVNLLNGRRPWPPIDLRREIGPLRVFESSAVSMVAFLENHAGLKPGGRLLDMGCGCGSIPLVLTEYGVWPGDYHGLDVDQRMIRWCNKYLASSRIRFTVHDYWSATYNPKGSRFLPFAVKSGWADVVLMKSVLTHLLPDDAIWYIKETARTLAPGGTAVITAMLYDEITPDIAARYPHNGGVFRYARAESPESSLALSRPWVDEQMRAAGLTYSWLMWGAQGPMIIRHAGAAGEQQGETISAGKAA